MILPLCCLLWHLATPAWAQETLSLKECREMALKYNKEMAASVKQTESARYTAKSYKGNFFPNFTVSGTGLYSNADGSYGIAGGNLPVFLPDGTGQFNPGQPAGFAYFPGINLDYKIGWVYMGGVQMEQPLYMGGKIRAAYKMSLLGKEMAQMNENLTATEVIQKTDQAYALVVKAKEMKTVADAYHAVLTELKNNVESAYKHGLKPQNDVLKVQVKLNESELGIRKAENALRLATMNLCHLIGIKGSYDYVHGLELNNKNFLDDASFSVLLNVSIPLFHFGERSNKVRAAKAKLEQTRLQQQNLNEQMLLELTQAANNLDEAKLESELADRSLQQAEENRRVSKSQYEVGLETLSDHLEAQALWQQAYETKVDARFQLYLNYVAYLKAAGTLHDKL